MERNMLEWKILIDNYPEQRIIVQFNLLDENTVKVYGEHKIKHNNRTQYYVLVRESYELNTFIQNKEDILYDIHDTILNKISIYNSLNEVVNVYKNIEINDGLNERKKREIKHVFGTLVDDDGQTKIDWEKGEEIE